MARNLDIYCISAAETLLSEDTTFFFFFLEIPVSVLPRPILIIGIEVIQHICLSRACCQTTGISERWVRQQGFCDTNITFTYNTHTNKSINQ